jgi:hypothetical protein
MRMLLNLASKDDLYYHKCKCVHLRQGMPLTLSNLSHCHSGEGRGCGA